MLPKKFIGPPHARRSQSSRNRRRNRRESTRTGRKKPGRHGTHRAAIGGDAAAGHDHVHMGMVGQRRAPGVQHRGHADAGAEVLGIGGDRAQRLGRGREQDVVDHGLVLIGDVRDGAPAA